MPDATPKKPLLAILDGHGIIHRAYYALKDTPLVAKRTGENTSAAFGFTNTLLVTGPGGATGRRR
jgi:5'-3' exonuclease